jgi:membrane fusion protein (multidrug efflux system)
MSKAQVKVLIGFIVIVILFGGIKGCQIYKAMQAGMFTPPPEAVTTATAQDADWNTTFEAVGNVAAVSGATLSSQLAGTVTKVNFESGSTVEEGATLLELDNSVEIAQLKGALALQARMKKGFDRAVSLRQKNAISIDEYDNTSALYDQAISAVDALKATIARKKIIAPFSGKAGIRMVNIGDYVKEGQEIVPLYNLSSIHVNFSVPQNFISKVTAGSLVTVSVDEKATASFTGKVTAVNPNVMESTRNVSVQATIVNSADELLRPGMFAHVSLSLNESVKGLVIPITSINYAPYGDSVYVTEKGEGDTKKVRQQFVKVGAKKGDQIQILSGIAAGDEIVTSGLFKLRPGVSISINNNLAPASSDNPQPKDT